MTQWHIEITRAAVKSLAKLDKPIRRRIQAAIDQLSQEPRPPGVVAIKSMSGHFRLRVGDWRVIYRIIDHELVVVEVDAGHRRDIYDR